MTFIVVFIIISGFVLIVYLNIRNRKKILKIYGIPNYSCGCGIAYGFFAKGPFCKLFFYDNFLVLSSDVIDLIKYEDILNFYTKKFISQRIILNLRSCSNELSKYCGKITLSLIDSSKISKILHEKGIKKLDKKEVT